MIEIRPGPGGPRRSPSPVTNPFAFWDGYYRTHRETPAQLLETVTHLGRFRKFDQVEAVIKAYLHHNTKDAESWMYDTLAVALDANKRGPDEVKRALGFAAYLAKKSRNPEQLIRVADLLYLRNAYEEFDVAVGKEKERFGVGSLLDLAAEVAPHLPVPMMMSINLAQKTGDPGRMGEALDRLLALGWPGIDDTLRLQARREAEILAKTLRDADRAAEADALLARLAEAEGRDLFVRLTWSGDADLDLVVEEPLGATASHETRRTVFGGCLIKEGLGKHPEEVYVCPRAFDGDYTLRVETIYNDPDQPTTEATLEIITHEGMGDEKKETRAVALAKPSPIVVPLTGGRRKTVLPFVAPRVVVPAGPGTAPPEARPSETPGPPPSTRGAAADALKPSNSPSSTKPIDPAAGGSRARTKRQPIDPSSKPAGGRSRP